MYLHSKADTAVKNRIVFIIEKWVAKKLDETIDLIKKNICFKNVILNSNQTDKFLFCKV